MIRKKEISRNVFKTLPWQVNTLISDVDDVAKNLNNKATTDKEFIQKQ
ncbi:hypothetical protein [Bacillus pseudomycoides]|nr:hypothetical protein [Bacillus pseudomycoides]